MQLLVYCKFNSCRGFIIICRPLWTKRLLLSDLSDSMPRESSKLLEVPWWYHLYPELILAWWRFKPVTCYCMMNCRTSLFWPDEIVWLGLVPLELLRRPLRYSKFKKRLTRRSPIGLVYCYIGYSSEPSWVGDNRFFAISIYALSVLAKCLDMSSLLSLKSMIWGDLGDDSWAAAPSSSSNIKDSSRGLCLALSFLEWWPTELKIYLQGKAYRNKFLWLSG